MTRVLASAFSLPLGIAGLALAQTGASVPAPQAAATPLLKAPTVDFTKQPTLYVVGYAHLDTQWRWTYVDTIREFIPNTLHDNFKLFEKYPDYVFNFSGSRRYRMMEEYYPADFQKMKGYIAAGRWFPCGSSVDENDANVPSAESLVRQVLYGNKYFRAQFGIASEEYMLPDCFGFPAALPSALAHCGLKGFSTQKLTWNAVVPIPFKVGTWLGPDGHGVVSALDPGAYVGQVTENLANSNGWEQRMKASAEKSGLLVDYHYYGTGDQGGGPTERSVAMVEESVGTKGAIRVISGPADWMFKALTPDLAKKLPVYQGELMLTEHSAGSITSQAYMKRWNRKNELLADAAERASVMASWMGGRPYPAQKLEDAWYLVLGSQMHDILPGTSVPTAYDYSWNDEVLAANQFSTILEDAAGAVISGMDTRTDANATCLVVYNPLSCEREDLVEADLVAPKGAAKGVTVVGPDGKAVLAQVLGRTGDTVHIAFLAKVAPVAFSAYQVQLSPEAAASAAGLKVSPSGREIENERYAVKIDDHGDVSSVFDKAARRELLSAPVRLGLHFENPKQWPAWNQDWADRQLPAKAFAGADGMVTTKVVESGPARAAVEIVRSAEGSTFTQRIRLVGGDGDAAARIEFDTDVDWRTRERSLRAAFPLSVSNPNATFDIQIGTVERPNSHEKQFEYSFHQWFDLTDSKGDYGVSVMCDSKFGSDKPSDNTVRLTLLHTPGTRGGYPDQGSQDLGRHHVLYALTGHTGDWRTGKTFTQAERLNQPMIPFKATPHEGKLGKTFSFVKSSEPAVAITAIKKAEAGDEVIVRLREHSGKDVKGVRIGAARPILSAREVDGQEREIARAAVQNGELVADLKGFELRAFALKFGEAPVKANAVESKPLALAFDTDVASTNAGRGDGSFDGQGGSIPAEQLPASLAAEGVTFEFGSTAEGKKNAIVCKGQEIAIPQGGFDRLYLLAASDGDAETSLRIDGTTVPLKVQNWTGYIGQWDHRDWPGDTSDPRYPWGRTDVTGIDPGYVKQDSVAWYCSHHHTPKGDALYEYCYLFKYAIDLPPGAKSVRLPDDPRVKVLAASVAKVGPARALAAAPLFDTLADHAQDKPLITPGAGSFSDATDVLVGPGLYWRDGAIRVTTDGKDPTAQSPAYTGPITLSQSATVKAAVVGTDGKLGPVAVAQIEVRDVTPPRVLRAEAMYQAPILRIQFSEPLAAVASETAHYVIEPPIAVSKVELGPDRRSAALTLASAPESKRSYKLRVSGVKDASPAGNTITPVEIDFAVPGPVYTLDKVGPEQMGTSVRDVPGLPVKAGDPWTLNMFVKMDKQPANRTIIAGFGKCEQASEGGARYMAKFVNGVQFWSHNRDVSGGTPLDVGRWQMLTATYDGKTLRLYKDGVKIGERQAQLSDDENVVNIAPADPWEKKRKFEGEIGGLSIWGAALGDEAVKSLVGTAPK